MKTSFSTDSQCFEFPFTEATIETAKFNRGFHRKVFIEIVAGYFLLILFVVDANIGIVYLSEVLSALFSFVNGHREEYLLHTGIHMNQIDAQFLVISSVAVSTGEVIST